MLRRLLLLTLTLSALALPLCGQTVDELIAKNVQARGGLEKLKSVQSLRLTGKMTMGPGMEAPFTLEQKRPMLLRMEFTVQGLTGVQAYDGTSGWQVMPFMGKKDPEVMTADDLKEAEEQADIDGPLVDYQTKGHKVELLGKDKIEGTDAYKLKLTRKNGDIQTVYLDADSYLEIKDEGQRTVRGSVVETETSLGDYKEVGGLMFPFSIESGIKGTEQKQKITIDKVEFNVPLDEARFKMPAPAPAPKPAEAPKQ
jgi:outer membrane lipoprotein-sorting protein